MTSPRSEFIAGIKAILPIMLGVVPFATISGIAAVNVNLSPLMAMAMSVIVFAGAAQLAALQLIGLQASAIVIILTTFIINLRFAMYSASLAPYFKVLKNRWKYALAYLLTDQAYAIAISQFEINADRAHKNWFYLGAASSMWAVWQGGTMAGVFLGTQVPASWSLDFAVPLTFIALVVPAIKTKAAIMAALIATIISVAAVDVPFNLSLIIAAAVGISAGVAVELQQNRG